MRVFITGSSGFVGSFFLRSLLSSAEYKVAVLLRSPEKAWRIKDLLNQVDVIEGDLDCLSEIKGKVSVFQPDAIVHLGWAGVSSSKRNDPAQWRNIVSTMELVELASELSIKTWIGLGSQAEYGPCKDRIDENHPTNPTTFYGTSKLAAQGLSQRLCMQNGIRYVWLRLFSSFGPMDNTEWLIPYLVEKLMKKERPSLTAAEQLWDYIYVEDVANALKATLDSKNAQGVFNLGSGKAYRLKTIIEDIRDLIDPNLPLGFGEIDYRSDQVMHLEADISKLNIETGWSPQVSIHQAIKQTVAWHIGGVYDKCYS